MPVDRLNLRRSLLAQFDAERLRREPAGRAAALDKFQQLAFSLLTSGKMREALDIGREPLALRERYGMTLFGQACLAARRLVEAGGKFVTVFWDGFGQFAGCAWDTHANHYPRLKEYLLPGFDLAYSALIDDLDERGLLDETLVLWMSEHGRTPQIDSKPKGPAAITGRASTPSRWPAAAWPAGASSAAATASAATWRARRSRPRTSWPRRSTCWASTRTRQCRTGSGGRCRSPARGRCAKNYGANSTWGTFLNVPGRSSATPAGGHVWKRAPR